MVPFGGWEMPLQYTGILAEARAVRTSLGLFDVSHMGRLRIAGQDAPAFLERVLTARVESLRLGRARYTFLLNEMGGIIDDCIVFRLPPFPSEEEQWLLVPNAANRETVLAWLARWAPAFRRVSIHDATKETVMIAAQGPGAAAALDRLFPQPPSAMRPFAAAEMEIALDPTRPSARAPVLVSRTGYTGEDGFELITSREAGPPLWRLLQERGGTPCGLGARDTLRLEAGLMLHGNDMTPATTPLEAGLERFLALEEKGDFVGQAALLHQRRQGLKQRLVGFILLAAGIPRHGYAILAGGRPVGAVTSGGYSPTLDRGIGMGYVPLEHASPDTSLAVDLRGRPAAARVVPLPFYRHS
jgi:aminomethyltransferase